MRGPTMQAIAMLVGMIVGVGVFALPFAFAQAGFFVGLGFLVVLGAAVLLLHLVYGEITLRTKRLLHLIGYGDHYFGRRGKRILTGVVFFGLIGSLLAYIIISGQFLETVFLAVTDRAFGHAFELSLVFFVVVSALSFFGVRRIAKEETWLAAILVAVVLVVSVDALRFANVDYLFSSQGSFFLPYGVVLFSLLGTSAIPEIRKTLSHRQDEHSFRNILVFGTVVPVVLYALFTLAVVGATGQTTTEEPFQGLAQVVGGRIIVLGSIFGFLAVTTSYLVLALNGIETLMESYGFSHRSAWTIITGAPLTFFLSGARDFISIVDVVGTILTALIGTALVFIWWRARQFGDREPEYELPYPRFIGWMLVSLFIVALGVRFFFV